MTTIQIKNRYNDAVLFECEVPDDIDSGLHVRHALEKATTAKADLRGADLRGADLSGSCLSGSYLRGADLRGADLSGSYLRGSYLSGADLRGSYLLGSYLSGADLSGSDLRGSDLSGSDLSGSCLSGAYLHGADMSGNKLVGTRPFFSIGPIGSRCDYIQAWNTDSGLMLRAGCFFGTKAEFEEKLTNEHGDNDHAMEYRAALVLIDKHAELWTPVVSVEAVEESSGVAA